MTVFKVMSFNVQFVWKDKTPVSTDVGIPFAATQTFRECPSDLDVFFMPGVIINTIDCMNDPDVCASLADQDPRATWVTSVCTGGLVLAAAGLLKGYDATAHWAVADLLPLMSARQVDKRVVRDRNRMTGGGVTTGQSGECYTLPVARRSPPFKTPGVATLAGASAQSALLERGGPLNLNMISAEQIFRGARQTEPTAAAICNA